MARGLSKKPAGRGGSKSKAASAAKRNPKIAKPKKTAAASKTAQPARASKLPPAARKDVAVEAQDERDADGIREAVKGTPTRPGKPRTRVTARTPEGADELKARIGELMTATGKIRSLRRGLTNNFYDIGEILHDIEVKRLYEAKGYSTFEAFVDREVDLGKRESLQVLRISQTFMRDAALEAGLERATAAIAALDGTPEVVDSATPPPGLVRRGPAIPLHKR